MSAKRRVHELGSAVDAVVMLPRLGPRSISLLHESGVEQVLGTQIQAPIPLGVFALVNARG